MSGDGHLDQELLDISIGDEPSSTESPSIPDDIPPTAARLPGRTARLGAAILASALLATVVFRLAQGDSVDAATNLLVPTPTAVVESDADARFAKLVEAGTVPIAATNPSRPSAADGLALFYGGDGSLQWLDLTTGDINTAGIRAEPLVQSGDQLVLASADHRLVGWLPLDALNEMPQGWTASRTARPTVPGQIWFFHLEVSEWVNIELAAGRVLDRRRAQGQTTTGVLPWHPMSLISGPDLISTHDGVFQWNGARYERVSTGRVVATTDEWALVERCDPPDRACSAAWFDRTSWDQVDRPTPASPAIEAEIVGDGNWLLSTNRDDTGFELIDLVTARRINFDSKVQSVAMSPDSQLIAFLRAGEIFLTDLDQPDAVERLGGFTDVRDGRLHFVQMPTPD